MMNLERGKPVKSNVSVSCVPAQPPCFSEHLSVGSIRTPVLIVDDDEDCRELLCLFLEKRGFFCFQAEHGKSALNVMREVWVALIITDFQMPVMNGCEFLERLSREHPQPPPAFMMTGNLTDEVRDRALKAGALMVLPKRFDRHGLSLLVEPYIRRHNRVY